MDQVQVNSAELRTLGTRVVQLGDALTRTVTQALPQLAPGGAQGSPWATLAQAATTATGWSDYLNGLSGRVKASGESLVETADMYRAADERSRDRMPR
jgi:hypothetical protein